MRSRSKKGFTLLEMLLTIAIIAILTAVAIPTFAQSLDKARRAADMSNARSLQIALATLVTGGDVEFGGSSGSNAVWILVRRDTSVQIQGYSGFNGSKNTMFCGTNPGVKVLNQTTTSYNQENTVLREQILNAMRGEIRSTSRSKDKGWDWFVVQYSCDDQGNVTGRIFSGFSGASGSAAAKTNIERAMGR